MLGIMRMRLTNTYDENGNMLTQTFQRGSDNRWDNYNKYTYTYDENGNRLTYLSEDWENNEWVNSSRYTYTYDENGNRLTYLSEDWENKEWVNSSRYTYTYDENGNLIIILLENWENDQWVEGYNNSALFSDSHGNNFHLYGYKIEITWSKISSVEDKTDDAYSIASFPNPFSNSTTIKYNLNEPAYVRINIYNSLGNKVAALRNEFQDAGEHEAVFNAENYSAGMYYYTIQIGERIESGKLLLLR